VRIAVDDFGTAYNNLQHLSSLPVDIIKINRMYLRSITTGDALKNALLAAIVGVGKDLGYTIIGKGVEEKAQDDYYRSLGCHYVQGHFYAKPMPFTDLLSFAGITSPPVSQNDE
jgi:EAL domain-containing protein (putative c-di-GMP-specific phosphodiesterase class I)